eukprot:314388-Rhodomonas_salina.1
MLLRACFAIPGTEPAYVASSPIYNPPPNLSKEVFLKHLAKQVDLPTRCPVLIERQYTSVIHNVRIAYAVIYDA